MESLSLLSLRERGVRVKSKDGERLWDRPPIPPFPRQGGRSTRSMGKLRAEHYWGKVRVGVNKEGAHAPCASRVSNSSGEGQNGGGISHPSHAILPPVLSHQMVIEHLQAGAPDALSCETHAADTSIFTRRDGPIAVCQGDVRHRLIAARQMLGAGDG
jgi:hypothetical protein